MSITKAIHQTWKTHDVPDHWKESEASWRAFEKEGWIYKLWDDADMEAFIAAEYPWFLPQFKGYPRGINRCDAWRYFVLHKYGGVYVDLDIVAKHDEFLAFYELVKTNQVVLPHCKTGNGQGSQDLSNCLMMSQPGVAFWPHVWARLQHPYKGRPYKKMLAAITPYFLTIFSTGPGLISDSYHTYKHKNEVYVAPSELLQPGDDRLPKPHQGPNSVVKVIEGSSWHNKDAKFWLGCKWFTQNDRAILGVLVGILAAVVIGLSIWVHQLRMAKP